VGFGRSVGSKAVRQFIEKYQPDVCVTGHIHESKAVDRIGKTQIINPGLFGSGGYVMIRLLDGALKAKLLHV
jgi:Icc-related predicted phosphoesterase